MSETVKTFIFDFDGVIVESMEHNFSAWKKSLAQWGVTPDAQEYFLLEGATSSEVAAHFLKDKTNLKDAVRAKEEFYRQGPQSSVYAGMPSLLRELHQKKFTLAVVSGGSRERVNNSLKNLGLADIFDAVVTADDVAHGKPSPEPYLKALEKLAAKSEQTLVVENAPLGISSAKAAGLKVVAVGSTLPKIQLSQADIFFSTHQELIPFLQQTGGRDAKA